MIQYNSSTNSGKPETPAQTNPYTSQNRRAAARKGGGIGALVWVAIAFAYVGIGRAARGDVVYLVVLIALIAAALIAFIIIKSLKRGGDAAPRRASQDGHICESPAEHASSERSAASTLDEMESGYRAYSYTAAETSAHESYVYKRIRKMTPEEYRKKLEELDSLLEAGMMTREEFNLKRREYAQATRGL